MANTLVDRDTDGKSNTCVRLWDGDVRTRSVRGLGVSVADKM